MKRLKENKLKKFCTFQFFKFDLVINNYINYMNLMISHNVNVGKGNINNINLKID